MEGNAFIFFKTSFGVDSCPNLLQIKLFTVENLIYLLVYIIL